MRALLLPFLLVAACHGSAPLDPDAAQPDGRQADAAPLAPSYRLVTLNLRCLLDDWDARLPLILAELRALEPDLVAVQEVCREPDGRDALLELRDGLAVDTVWNVQRAETHFSWDQYEEGIAFLSPHSLDSVTRLDLPVGVFPRAALILRGEGQPTVAVTHLSFGDEQAEVRGAQLGSLLESLGSDDAVIVGDFNEGPDGGLMAAAVQAGFEDLWATLHASEDGYTFPAQAPTERIDYILSRSWDATGMQRFLLPVDGKTGSDHLGLWAEIHTRRQ